MFVATIPNWLNIYKLYKICEYILDVISIHLKTVIHSIGCISSRSLFCGLHQLLNQASTLFYYKANMVCNMYNVVGVELEFVL